MRYTDYVVRARLLDKNNRFKVVEKSFKTNDARAKWLDKMDEKGELFEVIAFSDPQ